ncbi:MAG: hypothetical protein WCC66_13560 [Rhizobiaceae bacterium]
MFRLLATLAFVAVAVPASAEIITLNQSVEASGVRIIRGAPERCQSGPAIIHLADAGARKDVRCARENPVSLANVTINNTIVVVIDRRHKRHYIHRHRQN